MLLKYCSGQKALVDGNIIVTVVVVYCRLKITIEI